MAIICVPVSKAQASLGYVPREVCPADLSMLMRRMLRDLPGYINRAAPPRLRQPLESAVASYAIATSDADDRPLPLPAVEYPDPGLGIGVRQVFFTVLERQYRGQRVNLVQTHHWLFLARDQTDWHLALLFSQTRAYPLDPQPVSPPTANLDSATARAIRTWLQDCQAGAVRPP